MHRFYLPPPQCQGPALTLAGAEAHHAVDVLRIAVGEAVVVLDGAGREFSCTVRAVERKAVTLEVVQTHFSPAPSCRVTLVQAVPKGKLLETIIQKATELGAFRIIPLLSERVATRLDNEAARQKAEKWRQVAVEAIKQCGQRWLPQVEIPVTLPDLLARGEKFDLSLVGSLQADARHPREFLHSLQTTKGQPASIRLWIGPEGDFTDSELSAIRDAGGRPISLGPLVLRSDTAALYALSIVSYELQAPPTG
ncbi:MAG: RsmE family RNA methyltransferase [Limisphaerales bacterium]